MNPVLSTVAVWLLSASGAMATEPVSGLEFLTDANRRMQADEFANPGYLWVDRGRRLFAEAPPGGGQACAECHSIDGLRGISLGYPRYDNARDALINLPQQINECRTERQKAPALAYESEEMLSLTTWLGHLSKGRTINIEVTDETRSFWEKGRNFYYRRRGQLNLSCANCHEQSVGKRLHGEVISQGHSNGYPAYRHVWETLGSIHRMFQWCNEAVRAEPFDKGSSTYVNLEYYLKFRGNGLEVETPAVRR